MNGLKPSTMFKDGGPKSHVGSTSDVAPLFKNFGDCTKQPSPSVKMGEVVRATFVAGNPRNDPMRGNSFFYVQRLSARRSSFLGLGPTEDQWATIATDADWNTK